MSERTREVESHRRATIGTKRASPIWLHCVAERIEQLRVKQLMSRKLVNVSPDETLRMLAMTANHVHRVLVTEQNRLVGLVSSLDLVQWIASGRFTTDDKVT